MHFLRDTPRSITTCNVADGEIDPKPGQRLREARIAAGYPRQVDFYSKHGINQGTYSQHESGERGIRPDRAAKYAKLLGNCDASWILHAVGRGPRGISVPAPPLSQTAEIKGPSEKMAAFVMLRERVLALAKEYEETIEKEFGEVPLIFGFNVRGGQGADLAFFLWEQIESEDNDLSLLDRAEAKLTVFGEGLFDLAEMLRKFRNAIVKRPPPKDSPTG